MIYESETQVLCILINRKIICFACRVLCKYHFTDAYDDAYPTAVSNRANHDVTLCTPI